MDQILKDVGEIGRFQWTLAFTLKAGTMPIAWSMMIMAFAGLVPDWWCIPGDSYSPREFLFLF